MKNVFVHGKPEEGIITVRGGVRSRGKRDVQSKTSLKGL